MAALLCFVLAVLASPFKSRSRLEAENVALRHQLIVLRRKVPGRFRLSNSDRWFLVQLYRLFPSILQAVCIENLITTTFGFRFSVQTPRPSASAIAKTTDDEGVVS